MANFIVNGASLGSYIIGVKVFITANGLRHASGPVHCEDLNTGLV